MDLWKALEKQEATDIRDVGITDKLDDHLYMYHMPYSYTAEQIRKLRTAIFQIQDRPVPRVIMVTSAVPAEGKSLIASNLAISIAKGEDRHVLLVECDIRKPSLYKLFKYPPSKGVVEILQGKATVAECLIKTPIEKLTILPAAKEAPTNPAELLESKGMKSLIKELSERYSDRYLVIDTSPIQATVDPKILAAQVDAIIMVSRYRYTREADFRMALENLPREKVIGTVLNAIDELPAKKYSYSKYQYNKYYS
ncbi:MAG TPA: CpsD/CapB family tyrosine-protein kinase [Deltaproteobacteria bacterium]|jgi:capsular exopolysaccharide synthesis family protein|nr:CpsD/CapB family tyrosine-protein kinase [Deltaproteobacteria bacterium]HOI07659.1 CpsD/CapB family tyrosine-protein kinase [Deltaproteobacteria bacterium]